MRRHHPEPKPEPICGCGHHICDHEKAPQGYGRCHGSISAREWMRIVQNLDPTDGHDFKKKDWSCRCQHYVGPEPLVQYYAEEIV